jgi:hypothetical protein
MVPRYLRFERRSGQSCGLDRRARRGPLMIVSAWRQPVGNSRIPLMAGRVTSVVRALLPAGGARTLFPGAATTAGIRDGDADPPLAPNERVWSNLMDPTAAAKLLADGDE